MKALEEILNAVYIHGKRNSTAVDNLPEDEMTIADALKILQDLRTNTLQEAIEILKETEKELRDGLFVSECEGDVGMPLLELSGVKKGIKLALKESKSKIEELLT